MQHFEFQQIANHALDVLYPRVAEFHHAVAIGTDQMVVLPESVSFLVLRHILAKLVAGHQVAIHEQIQGIIDGGAADAVILFFHGNIQLLHIKMIGAGVYLLQNGEPFGGFAQFLVFQVCRENFPYFGDVTLADGHGLNLSGG